jgi:folate-binding protein YgfZ
MVPLTLHDFHESLGATFTDVDGLEAVADYGDAPLEHQALTEKTGVFDLSFRSRICLTGSDRVRFLHGQVTNDIKNLQVGSGCYAALVTAKGRMQSDLNVYLLADELLLDFEPALTTLVSQRLERYIVADDVQVVDIASQYGLFSVQGPKSSEVVTRSKIFAELPARTFQFSKTNDANLGEIYLMNQSRIGIQGFDLFVPVPSLRAVADKLSSAAVALGGRFCGWTALDMARVEAGIPRFGVDMDETNFPQECGIETRAVSYNKGCYIGQEVLNRIHTLGHVNQQLRGLQLNDEITALPRKGDKLFHEGKEVGSVRSALASPRLKNIALGYVRKQCDQPGTVLALHTAQAQTEARVVPLPFR